MSSLSHAPQNKALIFLRRLEGTTQAEFCRWWLNEHRPLAEQLPGLRRHAFILLPEAFPYDAIVEQRFDSHRALEEAYEGEIGRSVAADSVSHVAFRQRVRAVEHLFDIERKKT